jgi:DNA-binding ferritin-like protein
MKDLIALVRMMNLYYHYLHNIAQGCSFVGDHKLLADFYEQLDGSYDLLIERYIGLGNTCDKACMLDIITEAHSVLEDIPDTMDMDTHLQHAVSLETSLRAELEAAVEGVSLGTENLLSQLSDESEMRSYKLGQRLK